MLTQSHRIGEHFSTRTRFGSTFVRAPLRLLGAFALISGVIVCSQVDKAVDQVKLRAGISEAVELVKQRLHSSIATAHRYHNTLLPIKKLPSELLSTTIGHAMAEVDCYNYQERLIQLSGVHRGGAP